MKKKYIIIIFAIVLFINFVEAAFLEENSTWQQNITYNDIRYHATSAFGDIDNDGDLDFVEIGCSSGSTLSCDVRANPRVYVNNGISFVENSTWQQNITPDYGSIGFGDINNDGNLDLVIAGTFTKIYVNNGISFVENSTWENYITGEEGASSGSVNLGDIDNDGDLDLVMMDMGSASKSVWINNGTTFINSTIWGQEAIEDSRTSGVLVDIDNDGDLDSLVSGYDHGPVYINNGTNLELSSIWGVSGGDHISIAVGDVDNDGYLDYFAQRLLGACGTSHVFLKNNGSELVRNTTYENTLPSYFFGSAMFGDYNNDGFLDLVVNGQCAGTPYAQVINGNISNFISSDENLGGSQLGSITWADVDNDNNLDLVDVATETVYINNGTTPNIPPTPPISLSSSYNNRVIKLGWQNGSDNETVSTGLYYNMMVGISTNNHSIISGIYGGQGDVTGGGGTAFGYFGNMMQRKNFSLKVDRLQPSTTYVWYVQTIDTGLKAGNWSLVQSFTTPSDMLAPNVTINAPVDRFNLSSYTITFNATVFDNINVTNVSLWGSWNGGLHLNFTNSTGKNNTDYLFTVNLEGNSDGTYSWMIQAMDNATNYVNTTTRTFTLDTTKPAIQIVYPLNNTNSTNNNLNVNYSFSDAGVGIGNCWYSNDSYTVNTTLSGCVNITDVTWNEGSHNVRIYANDSAGNYNFSSVKFMIDTIKPNINITFPSNNTNWSVNTIDINYTVSDTNLQACWYSNDTYSANTTLTNCQTNITTIIWTEGQHNITIWTNDTFGNVNKSVVFFRIDTVPPYFTNLADKKIQSGNPLEYDINANDDGIGVQSFVINWTVNFSIVASTGVLTNTSYLLVGIYYINVSVNDTLGNLNSSILQINVTEGDVTPPNISSVSSSVTAYTATITWTTEEMANSTVYYGTTTATSSKSGNSNWTTGHSISLSSLSSSALYYFNVSSCDNSSNCNNSIQYNFTTSTAPTIPSGGGTGGGGGGATPATSFWTSTENVSKDNFSKGIEQEMQTKERILVSVGGENHYIGVVNVNASLGTVTINITSNPIQVTLGIGQETRLDISNDNYYDIYLKLISILNNKANLTIKAIHEPVFVNQTVENNETVKNEEEIIKKNNVSIWIAIISALLVFGGIFTYLWFRERRKMGSKKIGEKKK